jgi:hypothetical protein
MCIQTAGTYAEPPINVDIQMAIRKLKDLKAAGHDQMLTEFIKEGGQ